MRSPDPSDRLAAASARARPAPPWRRSTAARLPRPWAAGIVGALILAAAGAQSVAASGDDLPPAPDALGVVFGWSFEPTIWLPLLATAAAYLWAVRRVNAAHPASPVPRDRAPAFLLGLATIAIALQGGIARWDDTLFSFHMVQHLVLIFVAAPLLALGAPITLALRVASARWRRRYLLPALHSRVVRAISHPLVAWMLFGAVMWGTHVSPLFDLSLRVAWVHDLEHLLFLAASLLFWWPIVGRDPTPWRMGYPARLMYLLTQMPSNTFLGVVILFSGRVLYPAYAATGRTWGPSPLDDQQLAGAIMWGVGDMAFLLALLFVIAAWMRAEDADTKRREAILDGIAQPQPGSIPGPNGSGTTGTTGTTGATGAAAPRGAVGGGA